MSALVAAVFVIWLVSKSRQIGAQEMRRAPLAGLVLGLLGLQFALGIADVLLLAPAWMQLLHLLGADLYWVALLVLAAETIWPSSSIPRTVETPSPVTSAAA